MHIKHQLPFINAVPVPPFTLLTPPLQISSPSESISLTRRKNMPMLSQKSSNSMLLLFKLVLMATIFLSAGILLKFSAPAITDFAVYEVPSIYNGVVSWLRPPYLYLVINCIIISIVASSMLQSRKDDDESLSTPSQPLDGIVHAQPLPVAVKGAVQADEYKYDDVVLEDSSSYDAKVVENNGEGFDGAVQADEYKYNDVVLDDSSSIYDVKAVENNGIGFDGAVQADEYKYNDFVLDDSSSIYDVKAVEDNGIGFDAYENLGTVNATPATSNSGIVFEDEPTSNKENEYVTTKFTWNAPQSKDTKEYSVDKVKSPASARFGNRRNLKANPEGGKAVLGVSKPKKQDTLESTWKTITEGRSMPLTRHLRKNETWEKSNPPKVTMTKTETFNDRTNSTSPLMTPSPPGSGKLKKEPSLSQDELNRRVEAFIKKFNEDMRLQRQESLNQYVQMVNHGSF